MKQITERVREAILQALGAGVVPAIGLYLLQVAREREIAAILRDIVRIVAGGAAFRYVVGPYGSGKSFLLGTVAEAARNQNLVVAKVELTQGVRLRDRQGRALRLLRETTRSLSTRANSDGNALRAIVERFIERAKDEAKRTGTSPDEVIQERLRTFEDYLMGFEAIDTLRAYYRAYENGDHEAQSNCLRWLRGEYTSRKDSYDAIGVRKIPDDEHCFEMLSIVSHLSVLAGFGGLLVLIDEAQNLFRIPNEHARLSNFEELRSLIDQTRQGGFQHLGFIFAGTPEALEDRHRGLFAHEALATRLAANSYAVDGLLDDAGPVLRLSPLTPEDVVVYLRNVRDVEALGDPSEHVLSDEHIEKFVRDFAERRGAMALKKPRDVVIQFVNVLATLRANAYSGESGHPFRLDLGQSFRGQSGHRRSEATLGVSSTWSSWSPCSSSSGSCGSTLRRA